MPHGLTPDKSYEKRQKVLLKKVKKLNNDNPVVEEAIENLNPKRDTYADFEVVHELVSAAYAKYDEQGNLKECMVNLGKAITEAATKVGKVDELAEDYS